MRLQLPLACTVLKSTGSAFENFVRDEYTTLVEVNDRIFSTSIDLSYVYRPFAVPPPKDDLLLELEVTGEDAKEGTAWEGDTVADSARKITLETFALDESASVQVRVLCAGIAECQRPDGVGTSSGGDVTGHVVQDGAEDNCTEQVRGPGHIHAAEQALRAH